MDRRTVLVPSAYAYQEAQLVPADWFHLSMPFQYVAQAAKSWPDTAAEDCEAGTRLSDAVERIRWRLWHGQVGRSL
jgi:hypothetical protein